MPANATVIPSPSPVRAQGSPLRSAVLSEWVGKIHPGDCLKVMAKIPAESVGAVVTSPPYNIKNSTGNGLKCGKGGKWPKAELINGYDSHDDAMPQDQYNEWQRQCLSEMMRLLKPGGAIFYNHKWRVQNGLWQDRAEIVRDFPVRQIIIWQRAGGINFNPGYFLPTYEVIYLIAKKDFVLADGANKLGDVWRIPQGEHNPHPAPFPLEFARRCVESVPANAGPILDPFIGSGTTAIAAMGAGREWIGIEKSPEYRKMARKKIKEWS